MLPIAGNQFYGQRFFEKLVVAPLLKKQPTFYETRKYVAEFGRLRHWFLSLTR
jgi:hypothetical protein